LAQKFQYTVCIVYSHTITCIRWFWYCYLYQS